MMQGLQVLHLAPTQGIGKSTLYLTLLDRCLPMLIAA